MKKVLGFLILLLLIGGAGAFYYYRYQPLGTAVDPSQTVTINYWSVFERREDIQPLLDEFQEKNPGITVVYEQRNVRNYRQQLENIAGTPQGPDVFRFNNSWVKTVRKVLAPIPADLMTTLNPQENYYPVVTDDLKNELGSYLGVPLMYDGLALFYNTQLLRDAGIGAPPADWDAIMNRETGIARRLTVQGGAQGIEVAGIGMGTTNNVDHWQDLFALLMLQADANLALPNKTREYTESALRFFRSGVEVGAWSSSMPRTTEAFAQGKLAMMFGVSWRAFEIQAANPDLQFAVAPIPQLPGSKIGYANYWIEGVAVSSPAAEQAAAWKLLQFLSEKEQLVRRFGLQSAKRLFGEPYPRKDLAANLSQNQYLNGILDSADQAQSWYLADKTFGDGFNDQLAREYEEFINGRKTTEQLEKSVQDILKANQ